MTSVNELFPKSRKLCYDAKQQLSQVQNGLLSSTELYLSLDELSRQLDIMDSLVNRETPLQREVWKRKILEVREEIYSIRRQAEYYDRMMHSNVRQQRERDELLGRKRSSRRRTAGDNPGGGGQDSAMNDLVGESESLASSHNMVSELLASGEASLNSLKEGGLQMKRVKRVMLDIGTKIGLSNSTMRTIERRDVTDAYLVFAGMIVTLLVIYFLWF